MTQVAFKLTRPTPELTLVKSQAKELRYGISNEVIVLGSILAVLQILDGILTTLGVSHFGTDAEGNVILRSLMEIIGHVPALIVAKSLAIAVIATLCVLSKKITWVGRAFKFVIGIYLFAAIIPWTMILVTRVFAA